MKKLLQANAPLALWYRQPAQRWIEALPVGNGRLGAMVFGGAMLERLALNEVTLWSGAPSDRHDNPRGRAALTKIRALMFAGRFAEASRMIKQCLLGHKLNFGTNLPGGDLFLRQGWVSGEVSGYRRELDLDQGVARVAFTVNGVRHQREVLCSNPDGVLAMRLTAGRRAALCFSVYYRGGVLPCTVQAQGADALVVSGQALGPHSNGKCGVTFQLVVRVLAEGGKVDASGSAVSVTGADAATVLVAFNTDFQGGRPAARCTTQLAAAARKGWTRLRAAHVADHRRLFRRVELDLGGAAAANQPTDARLAALRNGQADPQLAALFFQYGRYLTIAGSREDSPLPMHAQGIWNDSLMSNMEFTCDYHWDINTQQNYWAAEVGNLSECGAPLFRFVESLMGPGRRTARRVYGIDRGWVCHVFTNAWGYTAPGWGLQWGLHVVGGVWIATHLWEHYAFTGDRKFLRRHAYPVLKSAAEFFLAYLVEDRATGRLLTGPSVSPENRFAAPGFDPLVLDSGGTESMGPTHDIALVRELFGECIAAGEALGFDAGFRAKLEAARAKLPPYRIGRHGQVQEWLDDFEDAAPFHRHTSHLVGLYPLAQITPRGTPDLARAAVVTLERRMTHKDWEDLEFSRGNAINYYARLLDGEQAHANLVWLLGKLCGANLFSLDLAPFTGTPDDIFTIDGNMSGAAGMAEMLLQSHACSASPGQAGEIELLPALPKAWPNGKVSGLRARGGFEVDIEWKKGKLTRAKVRSQLGRPCRLRYGNMTRALRIRKGQSACLSSLKL